MAIKQTPKSFWARVNRSEGCWEWAGAVNSSGYGSVGWGGKVYTAHRVAAWLAGIVAAPAAPKLSRDPTHVLHKCDNRRCCNPEHFFLGTFGDNMQDAYNKRRKVQPKGANHSNAKLTTQEAKTIRTEYAKGVVQTILAARYGVSQRVISLVVRGETYKCD